MNMTALETEVERHKQRREEWLRLQAARSAEAEKLAQAAGDAEKPALDPVALVSALIPEGVRPTEPAIYRAHVFRTEICEDLRAFQWDARFHQNDLFAGAKDGRAAKQAAKFRQVTRMLQGQGSIIALVGPRGTGKTTIAAQIAIARLWEDWESRFTDRVTRRVTAYRKMTAIVGKLKAIYAEFGTTQTETLEAIRGHLASLDLLVIDELNEAGDDSKHKDRILTDILDRRYSAKRDTILITNQSAEEFQRTANPSIKSRMNEHGGVIPCEWESFRDVPPAC